MRLNENDRKIISCGFLDAETTPGELARSLGMHTHTVRRTIDRMLAEGAIRPFPLINIHLLGYTDYCLFLSHSSDSKQARSRLLTKLLTHQRTAWVAELGGEFQYTASIFAQDIFDVSDFLSKLSSPQDSFEKSIAVRVSWSSFRPKYLWDGPAATNEIIRTGNGKIITIDKDEHDLLALVCAQPTLTSSEYAKILEIPQNTFLYRKRRLQHLGIWCGTLYFIDASKFGRMAYRVLIFEKHSNLDFSRKLYLYAKQHPEITGFVRTIGTWDYELNVELADPRDLSRLTQDLYETFGSAIRNIKTLSLLDTTKINLFPFGQKLNRLQS